MYVATDMLLLLTTALMSRCTAKQNPASQNSSDLEAVNEKPLLLVVAFDGFRHKFLDRNNTPNLLTIADHGTIAANGMTPVFPTVTMANFVSASVGLYPENSGVIANTWINSSTGEAAYSYWKSRKMSSNPDFYGGKPFWMVNDDAGGGRRSGSLYWPTADVEYGRHPVPNPMTPYPEKGDVHLEKMKNDVKTIIGWFEDKKNPINLCTYYVPQPDITTHQAALQSDAVTGKLQQIDQLAGYLVQQVSQSNKLRDRLNVIFMADHGFTEYDPKTNVIDMRRFLGATALHINYTWFTLLPKIYPDTLDWDDIYAKLKHNEKGNHFNIYRKAQIPDRLHIAKHPALYNLTLIPELGYFPRFSSSSPKHVKGVHGGFDNRADDLQALFVAVGPDIRHGYRMTKRFEVVSIYNLICKLLGVKPPQNDGTEVLLDVLARNGVKGSPLKGLNASISGQDGAVLRAPGGSPVTVPTHDTTRTSNTSTAVAKFPSKTRALVALLLTLIHLTCMLNN